MRLLERPETGGIYEAFQGLPFSPEEVGPASAVGASETIVDRDHAAFRAELCQTAFGNEIGIGFECGNGICCERQIVYVPSDLLVLGQMPSEPLIEAAHGTARVDICALRKR